MRADFQEEILKFLLQTKEGKKYVSLLEKDLWDVPTNQIVFELFAGYVQKFNASPSKVTLMEFFDREAKKNKKDKVSKEVYQAIEQAVYSLYTPFTEDAGLIRESIVEFAQRKKTKLLFRENADRVVDGDETFFRDLLRDMNKIVKLAEAEDDMASRRGGFLL